MKEVLTRLLQCAVLLIVLPLCVHGADSRKTIAVLGFINTGNKADDPVNKDICKSLIAFLNKVKDFKVTSYETIEKMAEENQFWDSKEMKADLVMDMGLNLAVKQVVTGTYSLNKKKNTIQVSVYVFDPSTSEMKLKKEYTGGTDLYEPTNRLVRAISEDLSGHPVPMGRLEVNIQSESAYNLMINRILQDKIDGSSSFKGIEPAEEPLDVTVEIPETGQVVFHQTLTLKDGESRSFSYSPAGSAVVRAFQSGVHVFVDNDPAGVTGNDGELPISGLKTGTNHTVRAEKDGKVIGTKTLMVEEGKVYSLEFGAARRAIYFSLHALQGGLGGTLGADYYFVDFSRVSLYGGVVFMSGMVLPVADADVGLDLLKIDGFKITAVAGAFCYFTSPARFSPIARLEFSLGQFFVEGGVRYGLDNSSINAMIGVGVRINYPAINCGV